MVEYKVHSSGTYYHVGTSKEIIEVLEYLRINKIRVHIEYGDVLTGQSWGDEYENGRIGRSCGPVKVPLLIYNTRSSGGGAILDNCIVLIQDTVKPHNIRYDIRLIVRKRYDL